ncbi:hypothetical protein CBS101457_004361 [Exobasidium rhododendri]|nr:hypothetical protein CBS101457_004361 [Exobasidium rhododendri]
MDWDPVKKRFFKILPEKAKIDPTKSTLSAAEKQEETTFLFSEVVQPSPFAYTQTPFSRHGGQLDSLHLQSTFPFASTSSRYKRAKINCSLAHAKNISTTTIVPWSRQGSLQSNGGEQDPNWDIKIGSLCSTSQAGSLLYFTNGSGDVFMTDTSHVTTNSESSCAISHIFDYIPRPRRHQTDIDPATDLDNVQHISDLRLPFQPDHIRCVSFDETRLAMITANRLLIYRIRADSLPRRNHTSRLLTQMKVDSDQIRLLVVRGLGDCTVLAFASQRQVGFCHGIQATGKCKGIAYRSVDSDIIALDITPNASHLLVGLRNGRVKQYDSRDLLTSGKRASKKREKRSQECVILLLGHDQIANDVHSRGSTLKVPGKGAVTDVRAASDHEVVVAFSSGQMFLISVEPERKRSTILCEFVGHVNSWSLDLPMCIDQQHRLLAVAGQDRKVRIWSLDHPTPLQERQVDLLQSSYSNVSDSSIFDLAQRSSRARPLHGTTFAKTISGLTFCQRRSIANMEGYYNETFLERDLPGLAVACHGNQIAFFE